MENINKAASDNNPMTIKPSVFLSFIVPTFNSENTLDVCLQAITEIIFLKENNFELIVSDDGSTDLSLNIAQRYSATIVTSPGNKGAAFARNLGAKAASGEYLVFIDSDVILLSKDIMRYIINGFNTFDICGISGCYSEKIMFNNYFSAYKHLYMCFNYFKAPKFSPIVSSAIMVIPRKMFIEKGGFNESYPSVMAEDIEFSIELFLREKKLFLVELGIKGLHLKKYDLVSLLKSDYLRTKGIIKMIKKTDAKQVYSKAVARNFGPLFLLPILFILGFAVLLKNHFLLIGTLFLICWVFSMQKDMFNYFREHKNTRFALLAVSFYFIEAHFVAFCALYQQLINKMGDDTNATT